MVEMACKISSRYTRANEGLLYQKNIKCNSNNQKSSSIVIILISPPRISEINPSKNASRVTGHVIQYATMIRTFSLQQYFITQDKPFYLVPK